jgi:hypothetical protein
MFEAGMFMQQDMAVVPTGNEYKGVGRQKDFDPNADGIMVHADCYLIINGNRRDIRSMLASSETPRSTCNMEPLSVGSMAFRKRPRAE